MYYFVYYKNNTVNCSLYKGSPYIDDYADSRHNRGVNALYLDGHAIWEKPIPSDALPF